MERRCRVLGNRLQGGDWARLKKGLVAAVVIISIFGPFSMVIPAGAADMNADTGGSWVSPRGGTLVTSFKAFEEAGRVFLEWRTSPEIGTVGFYLEREDSSGAGYLRVDDRLLPALLTAPQGGVYHYADSGVAPEGSYRYRLREVTAKGLGQVFGPYNVSVRPPPNSPRGDSGVVRQRAQRDEEALITGYSRKPYGVSAAKKARIEAMKREKAASLGDRGLSVKGLARNRQAEAPTTDAPAKARITVEEDGLYYLDKATIASALGMLERDVIRKLQRGEFMLSCGGTVVAYTVLARNTGMAFYGEGIDSVYTRQNVYWLQAGTGVEMPVIKGKGPHPVPGKTFFQTLHFEKDLAPLTSLSTDPETDYWIWDFLIAGNASYGSRAFTITAPGMAGSGQGTLKVQLRGGTYTPHHVIVSLNGRSLGGTTWCGATPKDLELTFDTSLLTDGDNTVLVTAVLDAGVPYSIFYLDSFDLGYARNYRAVGGRLSVRGDGNPVVSIEGFVEPEISVYDLTDPGMPKRVTATTVDQPLAGNFRVSFLPATPSTPYLALGGEALKKAAAVAANETGRLRDAANAADYLIIAPTMLTAAAQELADYRARQGLQTMVVDFQDILDEFNGGISSPKAIRTFLSHAYGNWRKAPRYVVLAGEGTYDYRNDLGYADSLIPPLMVLTPYGLYPSDNRFADVAGDDGVPEMAIGRLPVLTSAELGLAIAKLVAYEGTEGGSWATTVLMAADNPDAAGYFPGESNMLFNLLPDAYRNEQNKFYLGITPDPRTRLLAALNSGALLLNYLGHGGLDRLAQEGMLTTDDVSALKNGERQPVMTSTACVVGQFGVPGYDSISEALVMRQGGGVIAAWAATGLSYEAPGLLLDQGFFQALFHEGTHVLGDAVLSAVQNYAAQQVFPPFILDIFNILGDPALNMK